MGNLGGGEVLVILLVALVVLGPTKLPAALRQFGRFVGEVRRIGAGFQQELREATEPLSEPLRETKATLKAADQDLRAATRSTSETKAVKEVEPAHPKPKAPEEPETISQESEASQQTEALREMSDSPDPAAAEGADDADNTTASGNP